MRQKLEDGLWHFQSLPCCFQLLTQIFWEDFRIYKARLNPSMLVKLLSQRFYFAWVLVLNVAGFSAPL